MENVNTALPFLKRHEPRGTAAPAVQRSNAPLFLRSRQFRFRQLKTVELRSTGQPRAAVPTWFVVIPCACRVLNFNSCPHAKRSRDAVFPQGSDWPDIHQRYLFSDSVACCGRLRTKSTTQSRGEASGAGLSPAIPAPDELPQAADETGPFPKLGVGDLLEVSVYNVPELTTKSRLGTNGDEDLPLIDDVHVAGLTVEEAQALIEKRLSDGGFVKNPHVTLNVDQSASQGISLLGETRDRACIP